MIAVSIMGTRELWLNVVKPWQQGRNAQAEATDAAEVADAVPHIAKRRARG
jgi:hypothetical protein